MKNVIPGSGLKGGESTFSSGNQVNRTIKVTKKTVLRCGWDGCMRMTGGLEHGMMKAAVLPYVGFVCAWVGKKTPYTSIN